MFRRLFLIFIVLVVSGFRLDAAEPSPVGLWKTIDDSSGQPKGLVRIREVNGQFEGKVEKAFPKPGEDSAPKCDKCDGARRNQPVLGMTILWGARQTGRRISRRRDSRPRERQDLPCQDEACR